MANKHDIQQLKSRIDLHELIGSVVELRKKGNEYSACCPFHEEKTPSFSVFNRQGRDAYYCFGCGASGDHLDFLQDYYQLDLGQAIDRLAELTGGDSMQASDGAARRTSKRSAPKSIEWIPAAAPAGHPAPENLYINRDGEWVRLPVVASWAYCDTAGRLLGYTCRVEFVKPDGSTGKDVIPVCWKTSTITGEQKWKQGALPEPRTLYGAELLALHPRANVMLHEGEKATDAARELLKDYPAIHLTWPGGCKAVDKADWSLLAGRKVVGWPDCDSQAWPDGTPKPYHLQPGMAAMLRIAEHLQQYGAVMKIVAVPHPGGEWPSGQDMHDLKADGWTGAQVMQYVKDQLRDPAQILPPATDEQPPMYDEPPPDYDYPGDEQPGPAQPAVAPATTYAGAPFRILGWDRSRAYYLPDGIPQVTALQPTAHTKLSLMQLAPLEYWQTEFPSGKRSGDGVDWDMAANALMQRAQKTGIWDPELIRGRGAWWDRGKWAVHLGNRVVLGEGDTDPQEYGLKDAPTSYVYEAGKIIKLSFNDPLPSAQSVKLVQICERLRWERPIFGKLLAGWVFLAPVCGALQWRPHIWVTGGAGSGKTTVMVDIIGRCLERVALRVEGDTSEAGIRQALMHDARPVVFDEFESERRKAAERVEDVLAMVTRASSETGADLLKGGQDGKASSFKTRAMFSFASIGVTLKQHAARSRVTVLSLYSEPESEAGMAQFNANMREIYDTLDDSFIERMQARAVRMIPTIRANARIFAEAAALAMKDRRTGDQIGALLAGAYGLHSTGLISREDALEWINRQVWDEVSESADSKDEVSCLRHILSYQVRIEISHGAKTRNVGELIAVVSGHSADFEIPVADALGQLVRLGIFVTKSDAESYVVRFANAHRELKKVLSDTAWQESYPRTLQRVQGAEKCTARKFGGVSYRCVELPIDQVLA